MGNPGPSPVAPLVFRPGTFVITQLRSVYSGPGTCNPLLKGRRYVLLSRKFRYETGKNVHWISFPTSLPANLPRLRILYGFYFVVHRERQVAEALARRKRFSANVP